MFSAARSGADIVSSMTTTPGYPDPNHPSRPGSGDPGWPTSQPPPPYQQPYQSQPYQSQPYQSQPYQSQPYQSQPYQQYPQPGYGQPPAYPPAGGSGARPGTVTGAAVLAFIVGGLVAVFALVALAAGGAIIGITGFGGYVIAFSVLLLAIGGLFVWSGIWALTGRNGMFLTIVAGIAAIMQLVSVFQGARANGLGGLAISVIIIVLLLLTPSREWFRSRGGPTF
jgi:hypothetical protein